MAPSVALILAARTGSRSRQTMGNPPPYLMLGIKTAAGTRHYRAAMQRAAQLQGQLDGADSKERERLNEQIGEIQKKALDEALALDKEQKASTKPRKRK
jgi:hypothetical protein